MILSEGFGTGHTQAAHALAVSLKRMSSNVQTRVIELGSFLHPTMFPMIFNVYRKAIMSQPKLYGKVYHAQYKKKVGKLSQLALHRIFYAQTLQIIRTLKPSAIVCTHPFPNIVVSRLKRSGEVDVPLCTVITDYDAHGAWVTAETNRYLVSTQEVKEKLIARGVPSRIIRVTGIPVHPNFWHPRDKEQVRAELGLKALPTVLIMGGGWGLVKQEELLRYMAEGWRDHIQFIFVLGNNKKAYEEISADPAFRHENIRVYGYTREVDKLMEVSDILVTKPGGMTCTEALAKGLPMLFTDALPGQEERNAQYFTSNGFGEPLNRETIDFWCNRLVTNYDEVVQHRQLFSQMQRFSNPEEWTREILQMVN